MIEFNSIEKTLFVPMLGRIYASKHFPNLLYDEKALLLAPKLPLEILSKKQNQYSYLASACRSVNFDRYIKEFLIRHPNGAIVQLGLGLETTAYRINNEKVIFFGVDLPEVINYRKKLLGEITQEKLIVGDAFDISWLDQIRKDYGDMPLLVTASGLFYYFSEDKVISLLKKLQTYSNIEVVFDAVSKKGLQIMNKKLMKKLGHEDAKMYFYVDDANNLALKIGRNCHVLACEKYYHKISKKGMKISTKLAMKISDLFSMVKMIHLKMM